jgi:hypothetical protein
MAQHVVRVAPKVTAIQNAFINATTGTTQVLPAVAGASYRVTALSLMATVASTVKFQSSTGNTDISATYPAGANGGFVLPFNEHGWFQTAVGDALNFVQGTPTAIGVQVQYQVMTSTSNPGA